MLATGHDSGVLKVIISRGSGGRGYSAMNCQAATRILSVLLIPLIILSGVSKASLLPLVPYRLGAILILPD